MTYWIVPSSAPVKLFAAAVLTAAALLRDHATERKAQDVKPCQVERAAEFDTGVGQCRDGRWRLAGGAADAGIIEEDHVAVCREAVRHFGIPLVQVRGEIVQ